MDNVELDAILKSAQEKPSEVPDKPEGTDNEIPAEIPEDPAELKKQNEEIRKLYNRRDDEIRELREKTKAKKDSEEGDDEPDMNRTNAEYLKKLGFVTKEELDSQKEIDQKAQDFRNQMDAAKAEYKFIDESQLFDFMKGKPGLTVVQAAKLKYEEEFSLLRSKGTQDIPETDKGGSHPLGGSQKQKHVNFSDRAATSRSIAETLRNTGYAS